MTIWLRPAWLLVLILVLACGPTFGAEFSSHPRQPEGARDAMAAVVDPCLDRAGNLAFDTAYSDGLRVTVLNLVRVFETTDAAGLANRQAKSLIFAICRTLEEVVPEPDRRHWWDFLKD